MHYSSVMSSYILANVFIVRIIYSFNLLCFSLWSFFHRFQIFSLQSVVWTEAPRALYVLVWDENLKKMRRLTRASRAKLSAACHGILFFFFKTAFFLINLQRNLTSPQPARWRTETKVTVCLCACVLCGGTVWRRSSSAAISSHYQTCFS